MRHRCLLVGLAFVGLHHAAGAQPTATAQPAAPEFGPALRRFSVAHEEARTMLAHGPDRVAAAPDSASRALRVRVLELEADCVAARSLPFNAPTALHLAILWFRGAGNTPAEGERPSGLDRALTLARCSPAEERPTLVALLLRARTPLTA